MWAAKNENLEKALCFRRSGNLVDAQKYLHLAIEEGDADALYFMGRALMDGGFGIKKACSNEAGNECFYRASLQGHVPSLVCLTRTSHFPYEMHDFYMSSNDPCIQEDQLYATAHEIGYVILRDAAISGNIFALLRLVDRYQRPNDAIYVKCVEIGVAFGDGWAQYRYWKDFVKSTEILLQGASQMNIWCMSAASKHFRDQRNMRLAVFYEMEHNKIMFMDSAFLRKYIEEEDFHSVYEYGRWVRISQEHLKPPFAYALSIYVKSTNATRAAVLCFIWATKGVLVPDLRRLIGKMIWESRVFPEVWIENKKEIIKKQKL
jgi:hypothetical protein